MNLQGLGNSIINFPLLKALSREHQVTLLTWQKNGSTAFFQEFLPHIETIGFNSLKEILYWRSPEFDMAFTLFPAWRRENLALLKTRAKRKINFLLKDQWYTRILFEHASYVENSLDFEVNAKALENLLSLKLQKEDFQIKSSLKKKKIIIHPTASSIYKFYSASLFIDVINHFGKEYEIILISGGQDFEVNFCHEILMGTRNITYLQKPAFSTLINLMSEAEFFLGLDSSMGHLAAWCNCQVLSLWSFANVNRIFPYAKEAYIILSQRSLDLAKNNPYDYLDCRSIAADLDPKKIIALLETKTKHAASRELKYREGSASLVYY